MIILDTTNRSVQFYLAGAVTTNELPFVSAYMVDTGADFVLTGNHGVSAGTTPVTVVGPPSGTDKWQVKFIDIRNRDTAAATVIVEYKDGATVREMVKFTLDVGDVLQFTDGEGWRVLTSTGATKSGAAGGGGSTPTGTGFRHVTGGVEDAAAKLVDTADVNNDQITDTKLRNSAAVSVIGRSANSSGDPADIVAGADGDVLRRAGSVVGFGAISVVSIGRWGPM